MVILIDVTVAGVVPSVVVALVDWVALTGLVVMVAVVGRLLLS